MPLDTTTPATPAQPPPTAAPDVFGGAGRAYNIDPMLLRAMAQVESGNQVIDPRTGGIITSSAGAQGPMQFMPGTAQQYNVDVASRASSAVGAAQYMDRLLQQTKGDLPSALALYNGSSGDQNQIYARKVLSAYQTIQQQQAAQARASGLTSPQQPEPGVIDVGKPSPPPLGTSGRTGIAAGPSNAEQLFGPDSPLQDAPRAGAGAPTPAPAAPALAPGVTAAPPAGIAAGPSTPPSLPPATTTPAPAAAAPPAPSAPSPVAPSLPAIPPTVDNATQMFGPAPAPAAPQQQQPQGWLARNVTVPWEQMRQPELVPPGQQPQLLLGNPLLTELGAGTVQGMRDVAQGINNLAAWADRNQPAWLPQTDQWMAQHGWFSAPTGSTIPAETAAERQQYGESWPASAAEFAAPIVATWGPLGALGRGVGAATRAVTGGTLPTEVAGAVPRAATVAGRVLDPTLQGGTVSGIGNALTSSGGTTPGQLGYQDPRYALATGALGGGLIGGGLGALGARVGASEAHAAARRLGIDLTLGQEKGGFAKSVEDITRYFPWSGAGPKAVELRQQIARVVGRNMGVGPVTKITNETLTHAETNAGRLMDQAEHINVDGNVDRRFLNTLANIHANATAGEVPQITRLVDRIQDIMANHGGVLPGNELHNLIANGGALDRMTTYGDRAVSGYAGEIKRALQQAAQRSTNVDPRFPNAAAEFRLGRYYWKVIKTVEPTIERVGSSDEMSLPKLATAIRGTVRTPNFDMRAAGAGNEMQDLARVIEGPLAELPSSGTGRQNLMMRLMGIGEAGGLGAAPFFAPDWLNNYLSYTAPPALGASALGRYMRFGPGMGWVPPEIFRGNPLMSRVFGPNLGNRLLSGPQQPQPVAP